MHKFRVGQKVRLVDANLMSALADATATVKIITKTTSDDNIFVVWDRNDLARHQNDGSYFARRFEPVGEPTKLDEVDYEEILLGTEIYEKIRQEKV